MDHIKFNKQLFEFLQRSVTPFHAAECIAQRLQEKGFHRLFETEQWIVEEGKGYYCIRDDGSLLAWKTAPGKSADSPWRMTAAHTDSPSLQIKPLPETGSTYTSLGVEVYGGPLLSTWFDRDLGIAGRVSLLTKENNIQVRLLDFERAVATIPSLAIHLNRKVNEELKIDRQKHLYPMLCQLTAEGFSFKDQILQQLSVTDPDLKVDKLLGFDLFCYDTQPPALVGLNKDFITSGRLDNLVSCFVGMEAFIQDNLADNCLLLCSNHEEIGSSTVAGAHGNFLRTSLQRIQPESYQKPQGLSSSLLLSMDNAHALHPNFTDKHDPQHTPHLNMGPVIKYNANQRYATSCRSASVYKVIAQEAGIAPQEFVMKNDMVCGSTIGPIAATDLGIPTVDIGVPSLAMHSIREMTGAKDPFALFQTVAHFYTRSNLPQFLT